MGEIKDVFVGIDPGQKGAMAILMPGFTYVYDLPLFPNKEIDSPALYKLLFAYSSDMVCGIEKSQAMPQQGVSSVFTYGQGYGAIKGLLRVLTIPFVEVRPAKWKKYFSLGADKKQAATLAMTLFPEAELYGPKGGLKDGRAEALLIAEYIRQGNR